MKIILDEKITTVRAGKKQEVFVYKKEYYKYALE